MEGASLVTRDMSPAVVVKSPPWSNRRSRITMRGFCSASGKSAHPFFGMDGARASRHALVMAPKPTHSPPNATRIVEVLAFPAVQLLDVTGPLQVFASANDQAVWAGNARPYEIRLVAPGGQSVRASAGVALAAGPLSPLETDVDTLIVAGGEGVSVASVDAVLVDWVRKRTKQARRTASICTGAFLLGAAGVLDGRRAVTHWRFCAEFARRFPAVHLEPDPIFVRDDSIWTSAGVTAGIDLALALVEEDLGRTLALDRGIGYRGLAAAIPTPTIQ